jgi:hypothetical protein
MCFPRFDYLIHLCYWVIMIFGSRHSHWYFGQIFVGSKTLFRWKVEIFSIKPFPKYGKLYFLDIRQFQSLMLWWKAASDSRANGRMTRMKWQNSICCSSESFRGIHWFRQIDSNPLTNNHSDWHTSEVLKSGIEAIRNHSLWLWDT